MTETQTEFSGWGKVEVMGHQIHVGFVQTQAFGGTVLFRIDQPQLDSEEITLQRPQYVNSVYAPAGSVVKRERIEAASVLIGASSIYRITPCDEAAAMQAILRCYQPPLILVKLADTPVLATSLPVPEDPPDNEDFL